MRWRRAASASIASTRRDRFVLRPERRFVIYYQEGYAHVADVRVRFSLAHELGHFYIESHRERLCAGEAHDSEQGLISDKKREREADAFAASLLIPRGELESRMGRKRFMHMGGCLCLIVSPPVAFGST